MAISFRAVGTPVYGTANITALIPAAQLTGDMMLCFYGTKPFGDAPTINQGWASLGYATDGTVPADVDVGSMQSRIFWKIATSDAETNPIITNSTNNISTAVIIVFQKGASDTWATLVGAGGGDATAGTDFSATMSSDVGHTTGDYVAGFACFRSDGATPTTARNLTIAGCTLGTYTQSPVTDPETTSGGDMGMTCGYRSVDSGTSDAAPVMTATLATAHTGSAFWCRLRVITSTTYYQSIPAIEVASATFSQLYTWVKSLPGVETAVAVMSRLMTYYRILGGTSSGVAFLSWLSTLYRTLIATAGSTASLIKGMYKSLFSTVVSIADLIAQFIAGGITYYETLAVIETSIVSLTKLMSYYRTLVIQEVSFLVLTILSTFYRTLAVIEISIVSLVKGWFVVFNVISTSIGTLTKGLTRTVQMIATTAGEVPGMIMDTTGKIYKKITNKIYQKIG